MDIKNIQIKKGEVYWADLEEFGEYVQFGRRPVLILGNDTSNKYSGTVTVIPITARSEKEHAIPTHVAINTGLKTRSIILPEQIRTIPKSKLIGSCIYNITDDEQEKVENALKTQLGIS